MATRSGSSSPNSPLAGSPVLLGSMPSLCTIGRTETVLFESYLYKTPQSFIMKWSKRWFVLSTADPMYPNSIQLCYYKDESKKEGKRSIDLSKFVRIRPSAKVGNHQHVFAIETEERKHILKAHDEHTKNIWLAKLCELFGQEQVCHVTIPQQPSCTYSEAILKLTTPSHVTAITPSTGHTLLDVPFEEIRRLGSMDAYGTDVIWFETCKNSVADNFIFCTVPSGREIAQEVVRELKTAIESYTSVVLIMEVSNETDISFISRDHYGCPVFPAVSRNAILHSGLALLPPCWKTYIMQERMRRESEPATQVRSPESTGMSLDEWSANRGRRKAASMRAQSSLTRRCTLENFGRQVSLDRAERSSPLSEQGAGLSDSQNDVFTAAPSTPPPHNTPCSRKHSLTQQNSTSSLTSSTHHPVRKHSLSKQSSTSSSVTTPSHAPRKPSLSHQSSTSSLTNSTPSPPANRQRKLSYQSSVSSHSSTSSFPPHAPIHEQGSAHNSVSSLEMEDSSESFTYITETDFSAPAVPPRSDVSLRDAYVYSTQLAAH